MSCDDIIAVVEHNYTKKEPDELSLIKGESIYKINMLSEGWWQGVNSTGEKGMFPENFVRIVSDEVVYREKHLSVNRRCKAIYSYDQNKEDELTLAVGDVVEVLGEAEEGWWQGQLNGKKGVFPSNFVTLIETNQKTCSLSDNIPENDKTINSSKTTVNKSSETDHSKVPSLPPKRQKEFCEVEFAYHPQNEDELELKVGDIITIVSKEAQDIGWWKGEKNGKIGVFPDNFVKILPLEGLSKSISASTIYIKSDQKNSSFESKESITDTFNETGLQIGSVVQQRFSLEIKNSEISKSANENSVLKAQNERETKSIDYLEDTKPIPPTLPKKPLIASKKTGNRTSVAGNIITGFKKSVKNVEQKLQLTTSNDTSDGVSSSKVEIADSFKNKFKIEKNQLDKDFDTVERTTQMLQDVRSGRVKAPKRRLPTSNTVPGNENNNYINGISYNENVEVIRNEFYIKTEREENIRMNKSIPAKINAPWMAELKANQERKKNPLNKENISNTTPKSETSILLSEPTSNKILEIGKVSSSLLAEKEKSEFVALPSKMDESYLQEEDVQNTANNFINQNNNTIDTTNCNSYVTETSKIIELEKRVKTLESIVEQLRQELSYLKNVNDNLGIAKVVKNEIEKYV
ncbi:hypothetical protein ACFFRR_009591 [Megaselia abdita]